MNLDVTLFMFLHGLAGYSSITDQLVVFLASTFPYLLILAFVGLVVASAYPKREKLEILLVTAASSLIARFGAVELIRFFYHRPRPFITFNFHPLVPESSWSFPSGHATFFFGMAMAIYLYNRKWGIWFFVAATFISLCRVIVGVHYPSDIIGGALIGCLVAFFVDKGVRFYAQSSNTTY